MKRIFTFKFTRRCRGSRLPSFSWRHSVMNDLRKKYNYRPQRSFGQGNVFTGVCHSFCSQGGGGLPQCMLGYHPRPPRTRQTPPRTRQTPPDQADPPGPGRHPPLPGQGRPLPQDKADTPPGPGKPPSLPPASRLQHTVNERPVRILLECILVLWCKQNRCYVKMGTWGLKMPLKTEIKTKAREEVTLRSSQWFPHLGVSLVPAAAPQPSANSPRVYETCRFPGALGDTYVMVLYRYKAKMMLIIRFATKEIREERSVENAGIFVKKFLVWQRRILGSTHTKRKWERKQKRSKNKRQTLKKFSFSLSLWLGENGP